VCSYYRPSSPHSLKRWQYADPDFEYGDAYPGSTAPFLPNTRNARWTAGTFGIMPHWAKSNLFRSTYNARSETVGDKPSYRNAWKHRQLCVIPVDAFFEPNYESGRPVRWRIERSDGTPFGLAGIWEKRVRDDKTPWWSFSMLMVTIANRSGSPSQISISEKGNPGNLAFFQLQHIVLIGYFWLLIEGNVG